MPKKTQSKDVQKEIQPGEMIDLRFGRMLDGMWFASMGAPDEIGLCATAPWPWEALRGLVKLVKEADLTPYRAGGQEMGKCGHVSSDGTLCCALDCHIENAIDAVASLRMTHLGDDLPEPIAGGEIVRLFGMMKEPALKGKGDEGDELTASFVMAGDDLTPEYRFLRPSAKKQVVAIVYHAHALPKPSDVPFEQMEIDFVSAAYADSGNGNGQVEVLRCAVCLKEIHAEGQEPGMTCPICGEGVIEIAMVSGLGEPDAENGEPSDAEAEEQAEE